MKGFRDKIKEKKTKIAIVGFGYIGICIGSVIAKKGFTVKGIDTNKKIVEMINNRICPIKEPGLESIIKDKSSTIFVKLTATANGISNLEDEFIEFCSSFKYSN